MSNLIDQLRDIDNHLNFALLRLGARGRFELMTRFVFLRLGVGLALTYANGEESRDPEQYVEDLLEAALREQSEEQNLSEQMEQLDGALREIRPLAEAWADPNAGREILAILDQLT